MKIIALTAENFKRLVVAEIRPDGNLVQITGKNASGKTSILDAMWAALGGASHIQSKPIRTGASQARIRLDMGELIVTRTFRAAEGGNATTSIRVENAEGFRPGSPQKVLDGLLGSLSFDPLAFARAEPREQFNALRRFVPGVDFDTIDMENKRDFQRRTEINRQAKEARVAAQQVAVPSDLPAEQIDEAALTDALASAAQTNAQIETRKARREQARTRIEELKRDAVAAETAGNEEIERSQKAADQVVERIKEEIARLERSIGETIASCVEQQNALVARVASKAAEYRTQARDLEQQLAEAEPLPEPVDTAALTAEIADARRINDGVRARKLRDRGIENATGLEAQAEALTKAMEARAKAKTDAIAKAKLPIEGIGFGEGEILLNGVPFDQASDAEQLRTSIAIAMASNPKLRVIRVRDGSLLDEDGMRLLAEMADAADCQVWVESVDNTGKVGFVMEDGLVKQAPATGKKKTAEPDLLSAE